MFFRWILIFLAAWLVAGCGPSVEGLTNAYQDNKMRTQRYMSQWPGFKIYLSEDLQAAEAAWKATEGLSGDAQVQAMRAANQAFGPFFVGFSEIEDLMEEIPDDLEELDRMSDSDDFGESLERRNLWAESDRILEDVRRTLTQAEPQNRDQALMLLRSQVERLDEFGDRVSRVHDEIEIEFKKKKKKKKKSSDKAIVPKSTVPPPPTGVKPGSSSTRSTTTSPSRSSSSSSRSSSSKKTR